MTSAETPFSNTSLARLTNQSTKHLCLRTDNEKRTVTNKEKRTVTKEPLNTESNAKLNKTHE